MRLRDNLAILLARAEPVALPLGETRSDLWRQKTRNAMLDAAFLCELLLILAVEIELVQRARRELAFELHQFSLQSSELGLQVRLFALHVVQPSFDQVEPGVSLCFCAGRGCTGWSAAFNARSATTTGPATACVFVSAAECAASVCSCGGSKTSA